MIRSFACKKALAFFAGERVKAFASFTTATTRKLEYLIAAVQLADLAVPPGNHLEALKDDRAGQHSIRINKQWRICFVWKADGAHDVEIVDYH